jgi:hypothetical protein
MYEKKIKNFLSLEQPVEVCLPCEQHLQKHKQLPLVEFEQLSERSRKVLPLFAGVG